MGKNKLTYRLTKHTFTFKDQSIGSDLYISYYESQPIQHPAEHFDVFSVFVDCGQPQLLDFPPRTLAQVVEAPLHCNPRAEYCCNGAYDRLRK